MNPLLQYLLCSHHLIFSTQSGRNATGIARNKQKRESGGVRGSKTYHVAFTGPSIALWNDNLSKLRAVNSQIISTYVQKFVQWRKFADVHFWTDLIISVSTPFNLAHLLVAKVSLPLRVNNKPGFEIIPVYLSISGNFRKLQVKNIDACRWRQARKTSIIHNLSI